MNNYAIDSKGIGEALQRSAASFNAAGTTLPESIALITGTNTVLQDPTRVGNMWKTVSARLRGADSELKEMGEDTEGMVESTSKLRDLVKGMTGFDIMEDEKTFKSIYEIVIGIGKEFSNLSDINRASLLEALAGKNQSNALASLLASWEIIQEAYETAQNSAGSAMREQAHYAESIQYSIDVTKASAQELANDFMSSDFLKWLIDVTDGFIKAADVVTKFTSGFGILGGLIGSYLGVTNHDTPKMQGVFINE